VGRLKNNIQKREPEQLHSDKKEGGDLYQAWEKKGKKKMRLFL